MADGSFRFQGTAFWLGRKRKEGDGLLDPYYLVTAKHVIDQIRGTGVEHVWLRVNMRNGTNLGVHTKFEHWYSHPKDPTIDVSIAKLHAPETVDQIALDVDDILTPEREEDMEVGLGDEVVTVGIFSHRPGDLRNIPIVRVGNLSARDKERVPTIAFGLMEAYLVECRSTGGLSGAPVFINLGHARLIKGEVKHASADMNALMGIMHGHYVAPGVPEIEHINVGIALVTPIQKVLEVIEAFERDRPNIQYVALAPQLV
jgi:hypothetical protein